MSVLGPQPELGEYRCAKCGGDIRSMWLSQYMDDHQLRASLWLHQDGCSGKLRSAA
jgi:hypothetical protein